ASCRESRPPRHPRRSDFHKETQMSATRLSGRIAVVTGSASGLGRAIALRFAEEGATVVVSDVRPDPREGGENTEDLIAAAGGRCARIDADVSRWEDIDRLVSATVERFGRLDVMVNNAAIAGAASKPL